MRNFTLLLFTACLPALSVGQWTTDLSANTPVRTASSGEIAVPMIAEAPDGGSYIAWFENGTGSYQLRLQLLDAGGNALWEPDGLLVSDFPQNSALFRSDLKSDGNGNAIIAFQDERTGTLDVVAYMVAPDGSLPWGVDGVELPTPGGTGIGPSIAPLSNGNTVIAWSTDQTPGRVAFQILSPVGTPLLPAAETLSADTRLSRPVPVATDDGGFLLQYALEGSSFLAPATMLVQRFNQDGNAVWAGPVTVSTKTISGFYFPAPASDGHNGLYVAFNTGNPNNASLTDVYLQRVREDGSLWSSAGTRLDASNTTQKFTAGKGFALTTDAGGLMVPLQVTDMAQGQSGLSMQRVDTAGNTIWGTDAQTVIAPSAAYTSPWDIAGLANGAVVVHATGGFGNQQLQATRIGLDGIALQPLLIGVSTTASGKDDVAMTAVRSGQSVVAWKDDRTPTGVYAQNLASLDISIGIAGAAVNHGMSLEQNPAQAPVLLGDGHSGEMQATVFAADGRSVYSVTVPAHTRRMEFPLQTLPQGTYLLRLAGPDGQTLLRWVK